MNNKTKILKELEQYDLSIAQLAPLCECTYATLYQKIMKNRITDEEYIKIIQVCETNEPMRVFTDRKVTCGSCGNYFYTSTTAKYCSDKCRKDALTEYHRVNYKKEIKIKPLKYGENQKLLAKQAIELREKGMTYGQMSKQREIERIWGKL